LRGTSRFGFAGLPNAPNIELSGLSTRSELRCPHCGFYGCIISYAPHDKKMCSAIMSQKTNRMPSFDLRLHWPGVSSQNIQPLRWSAVEVGGLGSVWVLSDKRQVVSSAQIHSQAFPRTCSSTNMTNHHVVVVAIWPP
jgi:hypothetical protein